MLIAILRKHGTSSVEGRADTKPGDEKKRYAMHSFGAQRTSASTWSP